MKVPQENRTLYGQLNKIIFFVEDDVFKYWNKREVVRSWKVVINNNRKLTYPFNTHYQEYTVMTIWAWIKSNTSDMTWHNFFSCKNEGYILCTKYEAFIFGKRWCHAKLKLI